MLCPAARLQLAQNFSPYYFYSIETTTQSFQTTEAPDPFFTGEVSSLLGKGSEKKIEAIERLVHHPLSYIAFAPQLYVSISNISSDIALIFIGIDILLNFY